MGMAGRLGYLGIFGLCVSGAWSTLIVTHVPFSSISFGPQNRSSGESRPKITAIEATKGLRP